MATDKPRFTITLEDEVFDKVVKYQKSNGIATRSGAIQRLVDKSIRDLLSSGELSEDRDNSDMSKFFKQYQQLDSYGKDLIREVLRIEKDRCADEERFIHDTALPDEREAKVIMLYEDAAAAGLVVGITEDQCVPYELKDEDPQGASYAVRVRGDSMEPYFPDGSIAFVNHDLIRDGDIGVFNVDGAAVIKQYRYDPVLGFTYLFSLNRARADADIVLTRDTGRKAVCQGRVITSRRFPLPGR